MSDKSDERVLLTYVCSRRHHVLATVVMKGDETVVCPVKVPVHDVGKRPGTVTTRPFRDRMAEPLVVGEEPFWGGMLTCWCAREYPLDEAQVRQDLDAGRRRVALDSATG